MNIQDSPFHSIKNQKFQIKKINENLETKTSTSNNQENKDQTATSSFWDWFRGLVNPLQNLPLVSGIYSSMNSDDDKSDRDLIQNSLGGFMYGGPIGAMVGFGNWVFNKIFDKTPTELALDASGISNLWKDKEKNFENSNVAENKKNNTNLKYYTKNETGEWWRRSQLSSSSINAELTKNDKQNKISSIKESITNEKDNKELASFDLLKSASRYENNLKDSNREIPKLIQKNPTNYDKKVDIKPFVNTEKKKIDVSQKVDEVDRNKIQQFREINFDYPIWQPNELNEKANMQDNKNVMKQKYLNQELKIKGSNLNLKL